MLVSAAGAVLALGLRTTEDFSHPWVWAAMGMFVLCAACGTYINWPRHKWRFHLSYDEAQAWYRYDDGDPAHRQELAKTYSEMWDHNAKILRSLLDAYSIALIFLMGEVVSLTIAMTLPTH